MQTKDRNPNFSVEEVRNCINEILDTKLNNGDTADLILHFLRFFVKRMTAEELEAFKRYEDM